MGSRIWGLPFAVDRTNNVVVGIGRWNDSRGRNAEIGISFRAPMSGRIDGLRPLWSDDTANATGTGYAGGTGGIIQMRLFRADASGRPVGDPMATTTWLPNLIDGKVCLNLCPGYQLLRFRFIDFPDDPSIVAGENYVVAFRNVDPDPVSNYIRLFGNDSYDDMNAGQTAYLTGGDGFDRSIWGTVFRFPDSPWYQGHTWPFGTFHSGYDRSSRPPSSSLTGARSATPCGTSARTTPGTAGSRIRSAAAASRASPAPLG